MARRLCTGALGLSLILAACDQAPAPTSPAAPLAAEALGSGLNAEYFNGLDFSGSPLQRTESRLDFDWKRGAPAPGIGADAFTLRLSGEVSAPTAGTYTFYATADDGVRLNVNGQTVLNDYRAHSARESRGAVDLAAGERVPIELEYFEREGSASLKLEWSGPGVPRQVIPAARLYTSASPAPAPGQTYYVAPDGNDGGPGSQAQPWRTPDKAATTLRPGDTALFRGGVYPDGYLFITRTGTPGRPITYRAYPGETPVVRMASDNGGATLEGASYITVEGLTFEYVRPNPDGQTPQSAIGISINPGLSADGSRTPRLPHHVHIAGNTVRGFPAGGINTGLSDYVIIEGNTISETSRYAPNEPSAISLGSLVNLNARPGSHHIVRANTVYNNENRLPGTAIGLNYISDGNCIIVDDTRLAQAKENYSGYLQPFLAGGLVYEPYESQTLIENNLCVNNGGRGVHVYKSDHVLARNNTLYQNLQTLGQGMEGELSAYLAGDVHFVNNIVVARPGAVATVNAETTGVVFERNLHFGSDNVADRSGSDLFADPLFVAPGPDPRTADFRLRPGSPAIDAAVGSNAPYDDLGRTRRPLGAGPDLGAWETR